MHRLSTIGQHAGAGHHPAATLPRWGRPIGSRSDRAAQRLAQEAGLQSIENCTDTPGVPAALSDLQTSENIVLGYD